jgi:hypothetical protein
MVVSRERRGRAVIKSGTARLIVATKRAEAACSRSLVIIRAMRRADGAGPEVGPSPPVSARLRWRVAHSVTTRKPPANPAAFICRHNAAPPWRPFAQAISSCVMNGSRELVRLRKTSVRPPRSTWRTRLRDRPVRSLTTTARPWDGGSAKERRYRLWTWPDWRPHSGQAAIFAVTGPGSAACPDRPQPLNGQSTGGQRNASVHDGSPLTRCRSRSHQIAPNLRQSPSCKPLGKQVANLVLPSITARGRTASRPSP